MCMKHNGVTVPFCEYLITEKLSINREQRIFFVFNFSSEKFVGSSSWPLISRDCPVSGELKVWGQIWDGQE